MKKALKIVLIGGGVLIALVVALVTWGTLTACSAFPIPPSVRYTLAFRDACTGCCDDVVETFRSKTIYTDWFSELINRDKRVRIVERRQRDEDEGKGAAETCHYRIEFRQPFPCHDTQHTWSSEKPGAWSCSDCEPKPDVTPFGLVLE